MRSQWGGVPLLGPKIKRHSLEIVSPSKGTTPPLKLNNKGLIEKSCQNIPSSQEKKEIFTGRNIVRKKKIVTKKISPKSERKKSELKLMFERIRKKKENAAIQKEKESLPKENSSGPNVKKLILDFEEKNYRKEDITLNQNHTPSRKLQLKCNADIMKRIEGPISKHAASPKRKKKVNDKKIKKIIEKLKENSNTNDVDKPIQMIYGEEKKVRNIQQTIWDSWGPEKLKARPDSDRK